MLRYFLYLGLGLLLIAKSYAEPDFTIAKLSSKMTAYYHIHQQDMHFENKAYRLFIAEPKQQSKPLPVLYLLDGNAHFPLAVNAVNPRRNLQKWRRCCRFSTFYSNRSKALY